MTSAVARHLTDQTLSAITNAVNGMSALASAPSSSSETTTSASAAARPATTGSNSTTSSSDPRAAGTANSISSSSASGATGSSTTASSTSNSSSGDRVSGRSSVGGDVTLVEGSGAATEERKIRVFGTPGGSSLACLIGDAERRLADLPDESVHMIVTSPPYYNLRDYKAAGQLGQEATWREYVDRLVRVFREAKRALRKDGTMWLVMGDSYVGSRAGPQGRTSWKSQDPDDYNRERTRYKTRRADGLKDKDLIGVPWRLAFALQDDGWYLRCDMPWAKPNPMPESVTDRPTRAHEYVFLLAKSERYFYDRHAIMEASQSGPSDRKKMLEARERIAAKHLEADGDDALNAASSKSNIGRKRSVGNGATRNARSVWTITTEPFRGKHFAAFPKKLVEKCILAGTPDEVCPVCSAPFRRVVAATPVDGRGSGQAARKFRGDAGGVEGTNRAHMGTGVPWSPTAMQTVGWDPTCKCAETGLDWNRLRPARAVVLDPFAGAMTTAIMAERLGRDFVGVELNAEYVEIGIARVEAERAKWIKTLAKTARANRRKAT